MEDTVISVELGLWVTVFLSHPALNGTVSKSFTLLQCIAQMSFLATKTHSYLKCL